MKKLENLNKVNELMALLFDYQNSGHGHVSFELEGHCGTYSMSVYIGEWSVDNRPVIRRSIEKFKTIDDTIKEVKYLMSNTDNIKEKRIAEKKQSIQEKINELQKELSK